MKGEVGCHTTWKKPCRQILPRLGNHMFLDVLQLMDKFHPILALRLLLAMSAATCLILSASIALFCNNGTVLCISKS